MRNNEINELLNRRLFFKKGITKIIPILVSLTVPSFITSCENDDPLKDDTLCNECTNSCKETCITTCTTTCKGTSQTSSCTECSNSCISDCSETCGNSCSNECSSSCKNSSSNNGNEKDDSLSSATGTIDGYEYVDLGLSVKWARCNYGASTPSSSGSYLEFTDGATGYYHTDVRISLLQAGYESGDSIAGSKFDTISQNWGNKWRMPSKSEWNELIDNSDIERYEYNNTIGLKFTSKKNGKSIFLPGAGYNGGGDESKYYYGYYWTSVLSHLSGNGASAYYIRWSFGYSGNFALRENFDKINNITMPIRAITDGGNNPSSCNNSCTATCANNSNNSGCSNCSSSCSTSCKTACDYNCAATCVSHCYGSCNDTCGGGCKYVSAGSSCSGCASTCSNRCYHSCSYACSSNCQSSCVNSSK